MAYIKAYWNEKEERAEQAKRHTEEMEKVYGKEIQESIKNTVFYLLDFESEKFQNEKEVPCGNCEIKVEAQDSVTAILNYAGKNRTAVLNFASYKNPGGMFINGSKAQEECLCHESFLYNVLSQFVPQFYSWNNKNKNRALYLNRGVYSPDIVFCREGKSVLCDVITCAAPNKSAAKRYQHVSDKENTSVLRSRIQFVLDIARDNQVKTLILGAYGCGVFGQDAKEVASIFKEFLATTYHCFACVVFAVPKGKDKNLEAFEQVFKKSGNGI